MEIVLFWQLVGQKEYPKNSNCWSQFLEKYSLRLHPQSQEDSHGAEQNQIVSVVEKPEFPGFAFP